MLFSTLTPLFICARSTHGFPFMCVLTALMRPPFDDSGSDGGVRPCLAEVLISIGVVPVMKDPQQQPMCGVVACMFIMEPCCGQISKNKEGPACPWLYLVYCWCLWTPYILGMLYSVSFSVVLGGTAIKKNVGSRISVKMTLRVSSFRSLRL